MPERATPPDQQLAAMVASLERSVWPGRIEVVPGTPPIILDAAHNWASMTALFRTLEEEFPAARKTVIFGTTRDKDLSGLMRLVREHADRLILTKYHENPRGVSVSELAILARTVNDSPFLTAATPPEALALARTLCIWPDDLMVITGSFYLIAEVRESLVPHG
jgi:dihydrofolate synthase/folylpolyglutamate synthase